MEVRSGRLDSFSSEDLESARDVLISRFTVGKKSADHNRALIKRIFSGATFHCHRAGREVPTAGCSLAPSRRLSTLCRSCALPAATLWKREPSLPAAGEPSPAAP